MSETDARRSEAVFDVFSRRYLAHASSQVPGRASSALTQLAREALAFGIARKDDETLIRIAALDASTTGIDIVTADAPYLVDSVRAELERLGHPVERILHPQLVVTRDPVGALVEVSDVDDNAEVPEGASVESWMHVEVDRVDDVDAPQLATALRRVFDDVHHAVYDAPAMYQLVRDLADDLEANPGHFDRDTSTEAAALLRWLGSGNYMVLGHAAYSANDLASPARSSAPAEAKGVLRGDATISPLELLPAFRSGAPLVIFKSPLVSRVRRSSHYDCVTVVTPAGQTDGQTVHVFLGLITTSEDGTVGRVPMVRRRFAEILLRSGVRGNSHTGRQLLAALRTLPRDELLEAPTSDLLRLAQLVVARAEHGQVGVFARTHLNRDFVSVLVYFPAERFGPETRRRVEEVIAAHWPGDVIDRDDRIVELGLARMQFLIALRPATLPPSPDRPAVEQEVLRVTRRWSDDLSDLLTVGHGEEEGERLARRYDGAFPEAYKEDFGAATAVDDLKRIEALPEDDGLGFHVYTPPADDDADRRLKVYRTGTALSLARALPIFSQMGIEVLDERPYEITRPNGAGTAEAPGPMVGAPRAAAGAAEAPGSMVGAPRAAAAFIYDFGLRLPAGVDLDADRAADVVDTLRLLWREEIEQDGFNALVTWAGLTWWQANVLRAYAKYLRQAGTTFSQGYIEQALVDHPPVVRKLVELFESRFDPDQAGTVQVVEGGTTFLEAIDADLADVASLDQDRILRSLLGLINATLRTNAYRTDGAGNRRTALAIKLDPRHVPELPEPRPRFEIWVYSARVEGVHLRFGPVARGGLRWSDRREDFRTEILGLVKAQMVKNAVIVPVGAKGGFVVKKTTDPSNTQRSGRTLGPADRDAWLAEGIACYRTFVSCLLDLTDNYDADGKVVGPPQVRRYDGDDPYLVVAADKGTAKFSDLANDVAAEYGFWLGDAFASGGSHGYDHKAMGITARGAWESVKYHFRELGVNTQTQDFTVVGIGDMSGDVFGNGMLLSEHIRLVAAFDHRHIFLDPVPDAATSLAERRRLFDLSRSAATSWADYDTALISPGGGVYARTLKAVPVTAQVREALGLPDDTTTMTPNELIHAVLVAPVDLLWNGGIGTYVKASTESHADAGDKANDVVRADGSQLRCRVVGEGGNLGFTQLGRIEFARAGGRINTDAIDNSAGVDISDHEINLKILLDRAVTAGRIDRDERNALLASVADEVAALVLRDNYEQNVLLAMSRYIGPSMVTVHARLLDAIEDSGRVDRSLEYLPSARELAHREVADVGLCPPEMAVLGAWVKITLTEQIEDSTLPDEPWFQGVLRGYFPARIADHPGLDVQAHPLHREIITTCVVNDMVNRGGTTYVHRAMEETGGDPAQITRAYAISREVFGLQRLWADIEALDNQVPTKAQHAAYFEIRRLIDRATRWLVDVRFPITDVAGEIERFEPAVQGLAERIPELLCGYERENLYADVDRLVGLGLPRDLSLRIGALLSAFELLDVVEIARASGHPPDEVAELHFAASDRFSVVNLLTRISELPRDDRWSALARAALRHDLYAALSTITSAVLRSTDENLTAHKRLARWEKANAARVARARATISEALARETVDLATLSVAMRVMRGLPS
jgi:glutamate dehydrogenase